MFLETDVMAFNTTASSSSSSHLPPSARFPPYGSPSRSIPLQPEDAPFDVIAWYPGYQSCQKYFLNVSQHNPAVQALFAFVNLLLPYQRSPNPVWSFVALSPLPDPQQHQPDPYGVPNIIPYAQGVSLLPYVRRLVATAQDKPEILFGLFGQDWRVGVGRMHEMERRNYLFAAKSTSWLTVKQSYDMGADQAVPFLMPLRDASEEEISRAEMTWSEWLATGDWMLGPRAPDMSGPRIKRENAD